jgi:hypothetical protein
VAQKAAFSISRPCCPYPYWYYLLWPHEVHIAASVFDYKTSVAHALCLNNVSMQRTDIASSAHKATIFGFLCNFPSAICFYLHPNYRLSMGAKSQFTEEQNSWLDPVMAQFKAKLTQATGVSLKDDSLLNWKKAKCEDFLR